MTKTELLEAILKELQVIRNCHEEAILKELQIQHHYPRTDIPFGGNVKTDADKDVNLDENNCPSV